MKVAIYPLTLVAALCLAGCHASRNPAASSNEPAASSSATAPSSDKSIEKSRNAMMDKNMDLQSEHWTSTPAASSTTAPTAASAVTTPATSPSPQAASPVGKGGKH